MAAVPEPIAGRVEQVAWEVRPEWLAGRFWWRAYVGGHPKILVRYVETAVAVAEAVAAEAGRFRRESAANA